MSGHFYEPRDTVKTILGDLKLGRNGLEWYITYVI